MLKQLGCVAAILLAGIQSASAEETLAGSFLPGPVPAQCYGIADMPFFPGQPLPIIFHQNLEQNTTIWGNSAGHPVVLQIDKFPTTVTTKGKATLIGLRRQNSAVRVRLKKVKDRPESLEATLRLTNVMNTADCDLEGRILMHKLP